ncbi:MAG: hypothetical protein MK082_12470 [Phycisphaerales bacterium]|nr:hypothetical protein [Phycisphaerales bacterium]
MAYLGQESNLDSPPTLDFETLFPNQDPSMILMGCGLAVVGFLVSIWCLLMLMRAQAAVPENHRKIAPGLVWLSLIPCFNIVWAYFLAIWIPGSLDAALRERGISGVKTGRGIGLTYAVWFTLGTALSFALSFLVSFVQIQELAMEGDVTTSPLIYVSQGIGILATLLNIVFFVLFAMKARAASRHLEGGAGAHGQHGDQIKW